MACKRARHDSCSVFGCTNEHKNLFFVPSTEPLKNQWVNFIFSGNARVCAKHFTDDCFLNLGQYRTGLAKRLKLKSRSVPTLLGSASNLGQASTSSDYIQPLISRDIACQTDHLEAHTVGTQLSLQTLRPHLNSDEDGDAFGDGSTQCGATSESLRMDAPGTYHRELKILSVYGKGEGPLAVDGHDTLFTTSEMEALNSLSADHCVAKSLDRGERLVCRMELGMQQPPGTISIKVEEDISGEDGAASESLRVDAAGSSHMSGHGEELKILSVYGKGEGPLAVGGHDTLFTGSEAEAPSSLSADHSVAKSLDCGERLIKREELTGHRGGRKSRPYVLCHKILPNNAKMIDNMRHHTDEKPYGCDQCVKVFGDHSKLMLHMRTHTSEMPYKCDQCVKSFEVHSSLKRHMRTHTGEKPYKCVQCVKCYADRYKLMLHMKTHTTDGEKPFRCDQCMKSFGYSTNLKRHMRTHNIEMSYEMPYKCDQCLKGFVDRSSLKIHMMTHTGEKPYKCEQCLKYFRGRFNLKTHMRTHTGEKPYKCDQCGKGFGVRSKLTIHMRTHTGEKPYKCDQCGKCFAARCRLMLHMTTHTTNGEKPFKAFRCDQCMKRFVSSTTLKRHMKTHNIEMPYKCDQCLKGFVDRSSRKIHMRTHTGEKPYKCHQCLKCYRENSTLKSHMRTHTGEKPYKCDQCGKCYRDRSTLKSHMRTHTGEKPY